MPMPHNKLFKGCGLIKPNCLTGRPLLHAKNKQNKTKMSRDAFSGGESKMLKSGRNCCKMRLLRYVIQAKSKVNITIAIRVKGSQKSVVDIFNLNITDCRVISNRLLLNWPTFIIVDSRNGQVKNIHNFIAINVYGRVTAVIFGRNES